MMQSQKQSTRILQENASSMAYSDHLNKFNLGDVNPIEANFPNAYDDSSTDPKSLVDK